MSFYSNIKKKSRIFLTYIFNIIYSAGIELYLIE